MKVEEKDILKKIIKIYRPYKHKIISVIGIIILASIITMIMPIIQQRLIDDGLVQKNLKVIIECSTCSLVLILITELLEVFKTKYCSYIEKMVSFQLENKAFKQILNSKLSYFSSKNTTKIISNINTDVRQIASLFDSNTFYVLTSVFRITIGIIGLMYINVMLAVGVILVTPLRYIIVKFLSKKRKSIISNLIKNQEDYYGWYGDIVSGIKEVKSWGLESLKMNEFIKKQRPIMRQAIKLDYVRVANGFSETAFTQILTLLIYILGGIMILGDKLTIGMLFSFIIYSSYVTQPIFALMNIGYNFASIVPSAKRYFELIEMEREGSIKKLTKLKPKEVLGKIEFKNVQFSYENKKDVLKNINFQINPGEKVAIIGSNGSGKTTIINLLLRFIEPISGQILLDGKNINSINLKNYRELISLVSQEVYLFNTTINDNVILNSKKSEKEMNSIFKEIGIDKFIEKLPNKVENVVGERGITLSGGERQKISMARALIRESKILILDEATSNCDVQSEIEINNIIKNGYKDRTIIVITHRPDVLEKVDKIILVDEGEIKNIGTYFELQNRTEIYEDIVKVSM